MKEAFEKKAKEIVEKHFNHIVQGGMSRDGYLEQQITQALLDATTKLEEEVKVLRECITKIDKHIDDVWDEGSASEELINEIIQDSLAKADAIRGGK